MKKTLFPSVMVAAVRYYAATLARTVESFSPCAPPRFDTFSEKLVRSWTIPQDDKKYPVEEVMRSCGGAVQGIREIPLSSTETEGIYLNRANDGFLFLDDGVYSCGPIAWKETEEFFLTNLAISDTSRLVVTANLKISDSDDSSGVAVASLSDSRSFFLQATFGGSEGPVPEMEEMDPTPLSVNFSKTTQCLMPSPGQTWMLQRAKWQKDVQDTARLIDDSSSDSTNTEALKYWTIAQSTLEFSEWSGMASTPSIIGGQVVHSGVICESSGVIKAIARTYDETQSLKSVSFLEGCVS